MLHKIFRKLTLKGKPVKLFDDKAVKEAFTLNGHKYYMYENAFDLATGRGLHASIVYDEYTMKCDYAYLEKHCEVMDKIFQVAAKKTLDIGLIVRLNDNLKERLRVAVMPEYIYKLASVFFWDETESPYLYDVAYNETKIEQWKKDPSNLGFFLTTPLRGFLPFVDLPKESLQTFLNVAGLKDQLSRQFLSEALSAVESKTA